VTLQGVVASVAGYVLPLMLASLTGLGVVFGVVLSVRIVFGLLRRWAG